MKQPACREDSQGAPAGDPLEEIQMTHTSEAHHRSSWRLSIRPGTASFWGLVMIAVGGVWLLVTLLPFILSFAVPALLVYVGYKLITKSWWRAD